jgi:hypothetical protein
LRLRLWKSAWLPPRGFSFIDWRTSHRAPIICGAPTILVGLPATVDEIEDALQVEQTRSAHLPRLSNAFADDPTAGLKLVEL